jgi:hypothetical protein
MIYHTFREKLPCPSLSGFPLEDKLFIYISIEKTLFTQNTLICMSNHRDIN